MPAGVKRVAPRYPLHPHPRSLYQPIFVDRLESVSRTAGCEPACGWHPPSRPLIQPDHCDSDLPSHLWTDSLVNRCTCSLSSANVALLVSGRTKKTMSTPCLGVPSVRTASRILRFWRLRLAWHPVRLAVAIPVRPSPGRLCALAVSPFTLSPFVNNSSNRLLDGPLKRRAVACPSFVVVSIHFARLSSAS